MKPQGAGGTCLHGTGCTCTAGGGVKIKNRADGVSKVYFLGIGGIGMSALARYFLHEGKKVAGYDRTPSHLTDELSAEGRRSISRTTCG